MYLMFYNRGCLSSVHATHREKTFYSWICHENEQFFTMECSGRFQESPSLKAALWSGGGVAVDTPVWLAGWHTSMTYD